jgi:hypothetical protein
MDPKPARSPAAGRRRQLELDFSHRGPQLLLLRKAVFEASYPASGGKSVSAIYLKSVLRVIDDHAGRAGKCFASVKTIAKEAPCSFRTAQRALSVLRDLGLLIETEERRRGRERVNREICWSNLADLADVGEPVSAFTPVQPPAMPSHPDGFRRHREPFYTPLGPVLDATGTSASIYRSANEPPPPSAAMATAIDQAAAELVSLGVEWPGPALEAARAVRPESHVLAIIAYFREHAHRNGWGPGALHSRVKEARSFTEVERGWPPVSQKAAQQQQQSEDARKRREQAEDDRRRKEAEEAANAKRESELGPYLDAMGRLDQCDLAERLLSGQVLKEFKRNGLNRIVRQWLLRALEKDLASKP